MGDVASSLNFMYRSTPPNAAIDAGSVTTIVPTSPVTASTYSPSMTFRTLPTSSDAWSTVRYTDGVSVASAVDLARFGSMMPVFIVESAGSYTSRTIQPVAVSYTHLRAH